MHVFHTPGVPPRSGSAIFENIGSTANSSAAFTNVVTVNVTAARRADANPSRRGRPISIDLLVWWSALVSPSVRLAATLGQAGADIRTPQDHDESRKEHEHQRRRRADAHRGGHIGGGRLECPIEVCRMRQQSEA